MKKLGFLVLGGMLLVGCTIGGNYAFIDYGSNITTNEPIISQDGTKVAWVYQEDKTEKIYNEIFMADKNGKNKESLISILLEKMPEDQQQHLRIMWFAPEVNAFIYAIEFENPEFGPELQRRAFYKYFDEDDAVFIGENFTEFYESEKGIMGLRVGKSVAQYQFSLNNLMALDSVINYEKDSRMKAGFTDARISPDKNVIVYTFEYAPEDFLAPIGNKKNFILAKGFSPVEYRKDLIVTDQPVELVEFVGNDQIRVMVGEEEQVMDLKQ